MSQTHLVAKRNARTMLCSVARSELPAGDKVEVANADKTYGWRHGYCKGCAKVHDPAVTIVNPAPRAPAAFDLAAFAARVVQVASTITTGRFGDDRVFISHISRALRPELGLTEQAFRAHLLEANRRRFLSLSRADLVEAMDPKDVAESEVRYLGSTFNFIAL